MTGLLVSVRDVREATLALEAEVDLLDVKEPSAGPLGFASLDTLLSIAQIARQLAPEVPLSAAIGELADPLALPLELLHPYRYLKLGLAGMARSPWPSQWEHVRGQLAEQSQLVPVIYADFPSAQAPPPNEVLELAIAQAASVLLIDTWDKDRGNLFAAISVAELSAIIEQARAAEIQVVVAGKLALADVPQLRAIGARYWGVRTAVCESTRDGALAPEKIAAWKKVLRDKQFVASTSTTPGENSREN